MNTILALREGSYSLINTINTKNTIFYNIKACGYFLCKDIYSTERDSLNELLLLVTIGGTGYLDYRDKTYTLTTGKGFIIDCNDYQKYYSDKEDLWNFIWVHFIGSHSKEYFNEIYAKHGPIFIDHDFYLKERVLDIHQLLKEKNMNIDILSSKILVDILTQLLVINDEEWYSHIPDIVNATKNYIEKNASNKICLQEICTLLGISKSYLIRQFKNYTSFSPYDYLLNIRMKEAKSQLIHTNKPISDIALSVGFDSPSHFVNYFKKSEKITPLKYRQHWR